MRVLFKKARTSTCLRDLTANSANRQLACFCLLTSTSRRQSAAAVGTTTVNWVDVGTQQRPGHESRQRRRVDSCPLDSHHTAYAVAWRRQGWEVSRSASRWRCHRSRWKVSFAAGYLRQSTHAWICARVINATIKPVTGALARSLRAPATKSKLSVQPVCRRSGRSVLQKSRTGLKRVVTH